MHHARDVTQENELLTRMDAFDGVFVCATNLMDDLDPASLRRFDVKIRFDHLRPEQAWTLFREVLKAHGAPVPAIVQWLPRLAALDRLTCGDFATLAGRSGAHPSAPRRRM